VKAAGASEQPTVKDDNAYGNECRVA